ncbi:hypothetical protein HMPREF1862_00896 [Varibaculum cambriense]|uniref:Uncharacterized protein n=1 Tax=Varibaculum cambriense TaxID=184870 RepID=A0AB34X0F4_9ACTO|nr:hypothetical protein HMPREF1862_00896 [Varibaculum cambriense]
MGIPLFFSFSPHFFHSWVYRRLSFPSILRYADAQKRAFIGVWAGGKTRPYTPK